MQDKSLVLFATNESSLYPLHLELARGNATAKKWETHVAYAVLPAYRKTFNEPYEGLSLSELEDVAEELGLYYDEHLKEDS